MVADESEACEHSQLVKVLLRVIGAQTQGNSRLSFLI
jgi:hypothetical protein